VDNNTTATAETNSVKPKKGGLLKRILKYFSYTVIVIMALLFLANALWVASGSNQWELLIDEGGAQVYTFKSPGSQIVKTKAVIKVKAPLNAIVAFFKDNDTCEEYGCLESRTFDEMSPQLLYSTFKYPFPLGLKNREFVARSMFHQDDKTREIHYDFTGFPGKLPLDDCCFRVSHFYVFWRFTPLDNGEVQLEMIRDFDSGGFMPDLLTNTQFPLFIHQFFLTLPEVVQREKYQDADFDFIKEVGEV
jgi:hypothetical protein